VTNPDLPQNHILNNAATLLQHLANFAKQPNEDVVLLGEQLTGLSKEDWGNPFVILNTTEQIISPYKLKNGTGNKFSNSSTPYIQGNVRFEVRSPQKTMRLFFPFIDPASFKLTPKLTRNILGQPTANLCDIERYLGNIPKVLYTYETRNFQIHIWYKPPATQHLAVEGGIHPEDYYGNFANHMNFHADTVTVERKLYSGRFVDIARNFAITPPQTPEALLFLLDNFSGSPFDDHLSFAEKIFGLAKKQWGVAEYAKDYTDYRPYDFICSYHGLFKSRFSHYSLYGILRAGGYNTPSVPYSTTRIIIDDKKKGFKTLDFAFADNPKGFCLTPKQTHDILGSPAGFSIEVLRKKRRLSGYGEAKIIYTYEKPGYEIKMYFNDRLSGDSLPVRKEDTELLGEEEIDQTKEHFKSLEAHKSFCGDKVYITRKKYLKNYALWAKQFQMNPPKNGQELLHLLGALKTRGLNGKEFAEKLAGLPQENWGEHSRLKNGGEVRDMYNLSSKSAPYGILRDGGYSPPLLPYTTDLYINSKGYLVRADLTFSTSETNVRITPLLTREILGQPSEMYIRKPMDYQLLVYRGSNRFAVVYKYNIEEYNVRLLFPLESTIMQKHLSKKELQEYKNHEHLPVFTIDINRNTKKE
jgi:hypothetical protein